MEDEIAPEIEELQRRIYDALLPYIGKPLTLDASIAIKEVLSQAVQAGLLESYPHEGEIKCLIL